MAKPRLNQIVAVVAGKKTRMEKEYGDLNKTIQRGDLFVGLTRTYQPLEQDGEQQPSEHKLPQKSAADIISQAKDLLTSVMDAVATQEYGNCTAFADVEVAGTVILPQVPITVLLYLEKQLNDLHTFVGSMPIIDPAERWVWNDNTSQWETSEVQKTNRTKKVQKALVLYPATDKHPAQTQLISDDVLVGTWTTNKYSTAMSSKDKADTLKRIVQLQDAVKIARETANSIEVDQKNIGSKVLDFVFAD